MEDYHVIVAYDGLVRTDPRLLCGSARKLRRGTWAVMTMFLAIIIMWPVKFQVNCRGRDPAKEDRGGSWWKFICCYEQQFIPNIRHVIANFPVYYPNVVENLCHSIYPSTGATPRLQENSTTHHDHDRYRDEKCDFKFSWWCTIQLVFLIPRKKKWWQWVLCFV